MTTEESQLGPSQDGTVLLDIGGHVGALVIHTRPGMLGREIEVSSEATHGRRTHVAVRERVGSGSTRYAAVYPSLDAGDYTIWGTGDTVLGTVRVCGGEVTELDWRSQG